MQLFLRLMTISLLIGLAAGSVVTIAQRWQVVPIIMAAEAFEASPASDEPAAHSHGANEASDEHHHHGASTWEPEEGLERTFWTFVANVLVNAGFALLVLTAMSWHDAKGESHSASFRSGILWGAAGWFCLYAWPSLGLSPELPGEASAALQSRQAWWLLAALLAMTGLATAVFGRGMWRAVGVAMLALPFLIGAPHVSGPAFAGATDEAAAQLVALKSQFVVATALASLLQWLVIGALAGACIARWVRPQLTPSDQQASASPRVA